MLSKFGAYRKRGGREMGFGNNIDLIGVIYANFHEWKLKMLLDFHFLRKFNFYLSAKICLFS